MRLRLSTSKGRAIRASSLAAALGFSVALFAATSSLHAASEAAIGPDTMEIDVTNDTTRRWGEPQVAVNPKNPDNLVYIVVGLAMTKHCQAALKDDPNNPCAVIKFPEGGTRQLAFAKNVPGFVVLGVWVTFDRGKTWKRSANVPGEISVFPPNHSKAEYNAGDPMVIAAADGTFYTGWDALHWSDKPDKQVEYGGIAISKSTDGGLTWSQPVMPGTRVDRPMMASDLSTGIVYENSSGELGPLSTGDKSSPQLAPPNRYLVSTKDGVTWTKPQSLGGNGAIISAAHGVLASAFMTSSGEQDLRVAPNNDLCGKTPAPCMIFQTTTDAGAHWSRHVMPVPKTPSVRPMVAADPTKAGHFTVAFLANSDAEFHVYQTQDSGKTWSKPTVVTDDAGKSHYQGSIAYGPKGDLVIMWKSRNAPPGKAAFAPYNIFAVASKDGGATFSQPLKINKTESPAPDPDGNAADDITYVTVSADEAFFAYASWVASERAGYFAAVKLGAFKP